MDGLKVAEKVLDIRIKAQELKNLKLQNEKLAIELDNEANIEKEAGVKIILDAQIKSLKLKKKSDGDKINALEKSIKNLVNFIESGGEVDFILPEEEIDDDKNKNPNYEELRVTFQEIRMLEEKVKLIEEKISIE